MLLYLVKAQLILLLLVIALMPMMLLAYADAGVDTGGWGIDAASADANALDSWGDSYSGGSGGTSNDTGTISSGGWSGFSFGSLNEAIDAAAANCGGCDTVSFSQAEDGSWSYDGTTTGGGDNFTTSSGSSYTGTVGGSNNGCGSDYCYTCTLDFPDLTDNQITSDQDITIQITDSGGYNQNRFNGTNITRNGTIIANPDPWNTAVSAGTLGLSAGLYTYRVNSSYSYTWGGSAAGDADPITYTYNVKCSIGLVVIDATNDDLAAGLVDINGADPSGQVYAADATMRFSALVDNIGGVASDAHRRYIAVDWYNPTTAAWELETFSVFHDGGPSIPANSADTYQPQQTWTPTATGTYRVHFEVQAEGGGSYDSDSDTVSGNDISGYRVFTVDTIQPDLDPAPVDDNGATAGYWGPFAAQNQNTFHFEIENHGAAAAGLLDYVLQIDLDNNCPSILDALDDSCIEITSPVKTLSGLTVGEIKDVYLTWTPTAAQIGTHKARLYVDTTNAIAEEIEDNNETAWYSFTVEEPECDNGGDDDGDGQTDYPADTGCTSSTDPSESDPDLDPSPHDVSGGAGDPYWGPFDYGSNMMFEMEVANIGVGDASSFDSIVLIDVDNNCGPSATLGDSCIDATSAVWTINGIAAGDPPVDVFPVWSNTVGRFGTMRARLFADSNSSQTESDETNNLTAWHSFVVDPPECDDTINNDPAEDSLIDEADPECHTDGDASNPATYDRYDDNESAGATICNPADPLMIQDAIILKGESTKVTWINPDDQVSCTLIGPGIDTQATFSGNCFENEVTVSPLNTANYTLDCRADNVILNVLPSFQET